MPSKSQAQHNLMAMVANDPAAAKRTGISQSVGKEFVQADKGKKFGKGQENRADLQKINSPKVNRGANKLFKEGGEMKESKAMVKKEIGFMKAKGAPKSMIKHEESEMKGMKKMASGGITKAKMGAVRTAAPSRDGLAAKGKTKGAQVKMTGAKPLGMKRGGKC
jgi:hypothetical protein